MSDTVVSTRSTVLCAAALLVLAGCAREPTPDELRAERLLERGRQAASRGEHLRARAPLLGALALDERLKRPAPAAEASELLGNSYVRTASFDSARAMYDRSRSHYRAAAMRDGVRRMTLTLAALERQMGREREAFEMELEALRLARVFKDEEGVRQIQWAMLPSAGRLAETEFEAEVLAELARAYTDARSADSLAQLSLAAGRSLMARGEYAAATERFLRSTALAGRVGDSLALARAFLALGVASEAQSKTVEAFRHYGEALAIARAVRGGRGLLLDVLLRIGSGYLRYGQHADAQRFYRLAMSAAIDLRNRIAEGYVAVQLGHCEAREHPEQGRALVDGALSLFRDLDYAPGASYALASLGLLDRQRGQPASAVEHFAAATEEREGVLDRPDPWDPYRECERAVFGDAEAPFSERLLDILLTTGRVDEAFWYAERRARRVLLPVTSALEPALRDPSVRIAWSDYRAAAGRRLATERLYRAQLEGGGPVHVSKAVRDSLRQTAQALAHSLARLASVQPQLAMLVRSDGMGIAEVQNALPPEAVLISYVQADRSLHSTVIRRDRVAARLAAVDRATMTSVALELRALLESEQADADSVPLPALAPPRLADLMRSLSDWFIRPVAGDLPANADIFLVLPPDLAWLPVHTLRLGSGYAAPYLIERHTVSYLPTAAAVRLANVPPRPVQEVAALGHPGTTAWDVEYELRDIRAFYKDVRLHFRDDATAETLLGERGDLLHLALDMHVSRVQPRNAWMVLASESMTGLTVREGLGTLTGLRPYVGVVVSGLRPEVSVGTTAVPLVLLSNGTGTVVMNGYVPTRKAKRFFGEMFYTELLAGRGVREAAHRAALAMLRTKEYASPTVWGAFVVWGGPVRDGGSGRFPEPRPDGM